MASLRVVLRVPPRDSPAATASTSMSSTDEDASDDQRLQQQKAPGAKKPKKRKSSYHVRKEAMRALRNEEQALLTQLEAIRGKIRESGGDPFDNSRQLSLPSLLEQNRTLRQHVEMNRLAIAGAQSVTFSPRLEMSPLADYIHLPRDPAERRRVLQRLKPRKVEDAVRFMLARVQPEDLRRRVRRTEMFYTDDGDHVVLDWAVTTLSQQDLTVKMVFDAMVENAHNHEMAIADKLGVIAVRESEVCLESMDAAEFRILVEHGPRFLIEKHLVVFSQYFERSELLDEPHGVVVLDHVNKDDLHPYQPHARIRKDVTSATMVLKCPRQESEEENGLAEVTVLKWSYGHVHKSPLASDDELQIYAREANLFDVGLQIIRERLAWKAS